MKKYCITLDDNIRFLEILVRNNYSDLLSSHYIALLHKLHEKYDTKFQLNMFYQYADGGFTLHDVPPIFHNQFESFSSWLKLSFHSLREEPAFPYQQANAAFLMHDYKLVADSLSSIAGVSSASQSTTLHYASATQEALIALRQAGIKRLVGMFHDIKGVNSLSYCLSPTETKILRQKDFYYHHKTGITFVRNHLVLDKLNQNQILPLLSSLKNKSFIQLMTHEQYFYNDYVNYQSDYTTKLEQSIEYLTQNNYESVFLEDLLI